ncbi:Guanine nucleotide-binding protein alpha-3 subunit [Venturia nashicola]|nr:Guanine nucleotide-binding protein alpha-3 subunit [Venturia nashicola]
MRIFIALSLLAWHATVSASKHKFCCCWTKEIGCDISSTQRIINARVPHGSWAMSSKSWAEADGAPVACEKCYAYARDLQGTDDGWIGGDEMSDLCEAEPTKPVLYPSPQTNTSDSWASESVQSRRWEPRSLLPRWSKWYFPFSKRSYDDDVILMRPIDAPTPIPIFAALDMVFAPGFFAEYVADEGVSAVVALALVAVVDDEVEQKSWYVKLAADDEAVTGRREASAEKGEKERLRKKARREMATRSMDRKPSLFYVFGQGKEISKKKHQHAMCAGGAEKDHDAEA